MGKSRRARFSAWRNRLADRLAQSSQVFLFGLVIACGVEVLVDWSQTLSEINVLRDQVRQKGVNYAGLLEQAVVDPVQSGDRAALNRLAKGLLDDEDAIFIRIINPQGHVVFERMDEPFERSFVKRTKRRFRDHYGHWLERDLRGVLDDPEGFKQRLANSRYRDVPQMYSDLMQRLTQYFVTPEPLPPLRARIVYQDRLRDEHHRRDDRVTWALAPLLQESSLGTRKVGAVVVAFDMTRTNDAVRTKYLKGIGMVIFFVALILVQNISTRRDKLRLLDVGRRYAAAKQTLHEALPVESFEVRSGQSRLIVNGLIEQAKESVDGMIWDARNTDGNVEVLLADPDGDGIDAAAIGLHILKIFRRSRQDDAQVDSPVAPPIPERSDLDAEVVLLGAATGDIPLTRPIGLLLLRMATTGEFEAILTHSLHLIMVPAHGANREGASETPLGAAIVATEPAADPIPDGIIGPLLRSRGTLPAGATLVCVAAGKGHPSETEFDGAALKKRLDRHSSSTENQAAYLEDLAAWIRSSYPSLTNNDIAVLAIHRAVS